MNIDQIIRNQIDAANRHDVEAITDSYSADAVVRDPQYPEPLRGSAAIAKRLPGRAVQP